MILYGTLALCALGAALLVYRHDLYDREPPWLLLVTVGLGASAMNLAGIRGNTGPRMVGLHHSGGNRRPGGRSSRSWPS